MTNEWEILKICDWNSKKGYFTKRFIGIFLNVIFVAYWKVGLSWSKLIFNEKSLEGIISIFRF